MTYYASKIVLALLTPSSLSALLLLAGIALSATTAYARFGRRMAVMGLALLLIGGLSPLGAVIVLPLEERFPRGPLGAEPATGIIFLGGFEDGRVTRGRGTLTLNEAGERLTEAVLLARRWPAAKVVFTGGAGGVFLEGHDAADAVGDYLRAMGIEGGRIVLEGRSRTTWENALFTHDLLKPKSGERWLLITSAFHMPRAMGTFRKAGFDVRPWPVDYRTSGPGDLRLFDRIPEGLERLDLGVKEWAGLLAYWATGRSTAIWPAPDPR